MKMKLLLALLFNFATFVAVQGVGAEQSSGHSLHCHICANNDTAKLLSLLARPAYANISAAGIKSGAFGNQARAGFFDFKDGNKFRDCDTFDSANKEQYSVKCGKKENSCARFTQNVRVRDANDSTNSHVFQIEMRRCWDAFWSPSALKGGCAKIISSHEEIQAGYEADGEICLCERHLCNGAGGGKFENIWVGMVLSIWVANVIKFCD